MKFSDDVLRFLKNNGWNDNINNTNEIVKYIKENGYEISENIMDFLEKFDKLSFEFPPKQSCNVVRFDCMEMIKWEKQTALDYEETVGEQLIPIGENCHNYLIMISLSGKVYASFDGYLYLLGNNIYDMITNYYYRENVVEIPIKVQPCSFVNKIYKINSNDLYKYKEQFNQSYLIELDGKKCGNFKEYIFELNKLIPFEKKHLNFEMHISDMKELKRYLNKDSYLMIINNYNEFLINDPINKETFEQKYKNEILSWYDNLVAIEVWGGEYKKFNLLLVID